ncbi:hypothetical protein Tco_0386529 [Tanacetum coccineum]
MEITVVTLVEEQMSSWKVEGLKRMLISVRKLDKEGYHIGFRDQQWKVTKGSLVVAHRNKHGSLYMVERLSDISRFGMSMLASKGNIPDVRKVDIYFCKPGGLGKQKNLSFIMSVKTTKLQRSATYSSSLTKPIQKIQVVLVDILENLVKNDSIVAEHGLSSKITQSPGRSSDTSKGSENSRSFEDSGRSDEEYSEDGSILQGREALRLLTQGTKITESLCSVKEPSYVGSLDDTSTQHKNEGFQLASWAGRKPRVQFEEKYIRIKASTKTMCSDYEAIDALRSSVLGYVAYSDCKTTSMGNTKNLIHLVKNLKFCSWAKLVRILISEVSLSLLKILRMKSIAEMFIRLVMNEKLKFYAALTSLRVN